MAKKFTKSQEKEVKELIELWIVVRLFKLLGYLIAALLFVMAYNCLFSVYAGSGFTGASIASGGIIQGVLGCILVEKVYLWRKY